MWISTIFFFLIKYYYNIQEKSQTFTEYNKWVLKLKTTLSNNFFFLIVYVYNTLKLIILKLKKNLSKNCLDKK